MLNLIKMDLYGLFKTKSYYAIVGILGLFVLLVCYSLGSFPDGALVKTAGGFEFYYILNSFFSGSMIPLMIAIGVGIFICADYSSGYIKNIASSLSSRGNIAIANFITWFIGVVIYYIILIFTLYVASRIWIGDVTISDLSQTLQYLGMTFLLNIVIVALSTLVSVFFKKSSTTIICAVALTNFLPLIYELIKLQLDIDLGKYSPIANYSSVSLANMSEWGTILIASGICLIVYLGASYFITGKKDIA